MATNNGEANGNGEASFRPPPIANQQEVNQPEVPQLNVPQYRGQARQFSPNLGIENGSRRAGIPSYSPQFPPVSPYVQIPFGRPPSHPVGQQNFGATNRVRSHARSMSQPEAFSMDSLPPLSPSLYKTGQFAADVFMDEKDGSSRPFLPTTPFASGSSSRDGENLPPRKTHRRCNSDIPFGFSSVMQPPAPVVPLRSPGVLNRSVSAKPAQLVLKQVESNGEGNGKRYTGRDGSDDLLSTYMNLDNIDVLNSSDEKLGTENQGDGIASGSMTNGCDGNEATGAANGIGSNMQNPGVCDGLTSDAFGEVSTTRHHRNISMDSIIGNIDFDEDSLSVLPPPGATPGQQTPAGSVDVNSEAFGLEFGNGEFSSAELQKILKNEKLIEIAMTDPKKAKRILANRQSAARSKERKIRYTAELEHKVLTLQSEATTLSAQVTILQRNVGLLSANNHELRMRLESMQLQAQLRDALNETLVAEVQHLRNAMAEVNRGFQQLSVSSQSSERTLSNMQRSQQQSDAESA